MKPSAEERALYELAREMGMDPTDPVQRKILEGSMAHARIALRIALRDLWRALVGR